MVDYKAFLASKRLSVADAGFEADPPGFLYDFQKEILTRALRRGRFACFADCGLGKTPIQLAWLDAVVRRTNKPGLIFAPLAVSTQTKREADKFGIEARVVRSQEDCGKCLNIANYEMIEHFDSGAFHGVVCDESGILKNYSGSTRKALTEFVSRVPYRLACTATPAPNDLIEIINHAEFLGVMSGKEAIALFFRQDGNTTHAWRLKGHAQQDFWAWLASWSVAVRKPSDLGFDDGKFVLPPLTIKQHTVDGHITDGFLFGVEAQTLQERQQARRESIENRVALCAELANNSTEPRLIWCGLNAESEMLTKSIPDAVEVKGADLPEHKTDAMIGFADGKYRVLVTKPSIAGFGMNFQHCAEMAFVGLSDSWEQYYQAVRRCWRFGQVRPVTAHVIVADTEGAVVNNIERKERDASHMMAQLVKHMGQDYKHHKDDSRYTGTQNVKVPAFLRRVG